MTTAAWVVFGLALAALGYGFFVYPAMLCALARLRARPVRAQETAWPSLTVLIPVYNEAHVVLDKARNSLALDYPDDRLEVLFVSDGSTDGTVERLKTISDGRLRVLAFPVNRGKTAALNEAVPQARGDVVLLTDASGMLNAGAAKALARRLGDAEVGCVCGIYHIVKEGRSRMDHAESSYHGFEMLLREWEGRIRTTLSGTGSIMALRKADFQPFPDGAINEDFILPARIALAGKRVVYADDAHVDDRISTSFRAVFRRRVRIAFGNWQQIGILKGLLNPRRGYLFWVYVSHKLLRMTVPFLLVLMLACAAVILPGWAALALGLAFLGALMLGLLGLWLDRWVRGHNPLGFLVLIFLNSLAVFVGTYHYVTGKRVRW